LGLWRALVRFPVLAVAPTFSGCVWAECDRSARVRAQLGVAGAIALLAAWWLTIRPSNTRDWQPEVAETPYAEIEGDRVVIHNFRNFDYMSKTDFRPRWETKTVHLSNLRTVDFFTNYWGSKLICHTFVSFDFGPEGYVCISIETRMTKGQAYSAIAGLYRQFALYYVVGDERDIVRLRTNYRLEDVYLYRLIPATPERSRALFLDYVKSANELHERAQWYNELTSNCTSNVRLHIKHIGSAHPWDWQLLVNGSIDEHAYELGALDTSLPFAELKRRSHINERARAADRDPAFSSRIRDGLPGETALGRSFGPVPCSPSWKTHSKPSHGPWRCPEPRVLIN
jgi:hypothetical protein